MGAPRGTGHSTWRFNAWLTAVLALGVLVGANRLARERLDLRVDLSEDRLFAPSPIGTRMLGELEDVLQVKAFFTGEVRLGPVQIAKRRLIDQLEEFVDTGRGRVELAFVDPNASSEARAEARTLGIQPVPLRAVQGTSEVAQDVYLGLLLRYRGKETVLPWVLPQTFEFAFLGGLRKLLRTAEIEVGFLTRRGDGATDEFGQVRGLLAGQYRLHEILDLDVGEAVPEGVSVLVVARPVELHPRTVFAIDQFLQRGGRVLALVDRALVDLIQGTVTPVRTGLEEAFALWGAPVGAGLVWDQARPNLITTYETVRIGDREESGGRVRIPYPFWPNVGVEGLDRETPVTARLEGADLFWAHPIEAADPAPPGLERRDLLRSSATSFVVDADEALTLDPGALGRLSVALLAEATAEPRTLAVSLSGRFRSPFGEGAGAPAPRDPIEEALVAERTRRALDLGLEPPEVEPRTTDEEVLSAAAATQLVLVGDADWASDGKFLTERNRVLFVNLIDWLALEDDLIALRARIPTNRAIDDFVEEERRALGLVGLRADLGDFGTPAVARLEAEADRRAARRRWLMMGSATGGSLLAALLLGLLWSAAVARRLRPAGEEGR